MSAPVPVGLCRAVIDLDAVQHNAAVLAACAPDSRLMAVVKADGYGHGAVGVAQAALRGGADALGVTSIAEALVLREAGIDCEILAWMFSVDADVRVALEADIDLGLASPAHLDPVLAAAEATGKRARVTPKLDTGLGRSGIRLDDFAEMLPRLVRAEQDGLIEVTGLMAHYAHADDPGHPVIAEQLERFHGAIAEARTAGLAVPCNHHANSAATLTKPDDGMQMMRPGIALYGLSPIDGEQFGLIPAMTFSAEILLVKELPAGEGVSYGHTWHAPHDTVVALVAAGYADGVSRLLSNGFEVSVRGRRFPNVGRVCMDQFVIDLGPGNPHGVRAGEQAVMFGTGSDGGPTAAEWAEKLGTIHYEVVTSVHGRAQRIVESSANPGGES